MTDFRDTARGIVAMLLCCLSFIINDTLVKAAGETMPLGQVIFLRGVFATLTVGVLCWWLGQLRGLRRHLTAMVGWRTFGEVVATVLYLTALLEMPIANASAIAQAAPLVITAAGAIFLGEKVGWRRWAAVGIGFGGILLVVRPGADGFNAWSLLALASVFLVAVRDITTRFIPASTPTLVVALITSVAVTVIGGGMAATEDWAPLGLNQWLMMVGAGVTLITGFTFIIVAMRNGDVSIVAPFRYSFIPYAILIGWLVWGDVPDALTLLGIAIVVATGVYTFYRERKMAKLALVQSKGVAVIA